MLRVLVCGGRNYEDRGLVFRRLDSLKPSVVIQGGAEGADRWAREWSDKTGANLITEFARWDLHGKKAGPLRNQQMLDNHTPDVVLAFPGGAGTADMVRRAEASGVWVIPAEGKSNGPK